MLAGHYSRAVANDLLSRAEEANNPLTPMQLIKLVYLSHGWMLGLYGRPLIKERVEAWLYGPVIRDLYNAVRRFRDQSVDGSLRVPRGDREFDAHERDLIDQVFRKYGHYSDIALSRLTHAPGSPWSKTWDSVGQNAPIPNDLIEDHFAQLARGA